MLENLILEDVSETDLLSGGYKKDEDAGKMSFRSARCSDNRPSLELWSRVSELQASNSDQLASEMWGTLRQMAVFMRELELSAKERRIKKLTQKSGDWSKFCQAEERFAASLERGKRSMASLAKALALDPPHKPALQPIQLYRRISEFEEFSENRNAKERIEELSFCLREVIGRFAKICEAEGIKHGLPVITPPEIPPPSIDSLPKMKKRISNVELPVIKIPEVKKEPESNNIVYDYGDKIASDTPIEEPKEGVMMPVDLVWEYCKRDRSTPIYEDMGMVGKAPFTQEFVVLCRLRHLSGEGKAKRKSTAKQCAAAMLIKSMLNRMRLDKLPTDFRPFSAQERLLAVRVISEVLNFEKELEKVSQEEYFRSPIYAPVVNSTGNHYRCKALGYNSVGYGRTKEVARRMSAKLILDMHKDAKELAKRNTKMKFEASKGNVSSISMIKTS